MGARRSTFSHVVASTAMFITVVNAIVAGTLGALVAEAAGAPTWLIALIGALSGLGFLGGTLAFTLQKFAPDAYEPRFPTPEG
jgi:hypothetical protein